MTRRRPGPRFCLCGADLSGCHGRTIRCWTCQRSANLESHRRANRARYARTRTSGLCGNCHRQPTAPGSSRCAPCKIAITARAKVRRKRRLDAGLCEQCGENPRGQFRECLRCRVKRSANENASRKRQTPRQTPIQ